jgi:predicted DNA-binding protein (MmcQ/YjbR family)
MKYEWLDSYCLSKKGAVMEFKPEWNTTVYWIGPKFFASRGGDKAGKPIITLKCEPLYGQLLREQYPEIIPGYYMNKAHWNSVYLEGEVPDDVLKDMIDASYKAVLAGLTKKQQAEITK